MWNKRLTRPAISVAYVAAMLLPVFVFFHDRGGTAWLHGLTLKSDFQLLFPLLGLYAFTFVSWQILINTNLRWLRQVFPRALSFHRFQGGFALLFATFHPAFILLGYGISDDLHLRFVSNPQKWWLLPAYTALIILWLTVLTALLAWYGRNIPWWRKLHRLNYLVFVLAWLHSWFIGTDLHTTLLRSVWLGYLIAVAVSTFSRYYPKLQEAIKRKETNYA